MDFLDLLLKHEENGIWRVASLELFGERMGKQILLRTLFVRFQGITDYRMKAGRGGGIVSGGHKIGREESVREKGTYPRIRTVCCTTCTTPAIDNVIVT